MRFQIEWPWTTYSFKKESFIHVFDSYSFFIPLIKNNSYDMIYSIFLKCKNAWINYNKKNTNLQKDFIYLFKGNINK